MLTVNIKSLPQKKKNTDCSQYYVINILYMKITHSDAHNLVYLNLKTFFYLPFFLYSIFGFSPI